jgi:hypothetical protein
VSPVFICRVDPQPSHPVELFDAGNNSTWILLLFCLTSGSHQRLNRPCQKLLSIDTGLINISLDLRPGTLEQFISTSPANPPLLSGKSKT